MLGLFNNQLAGLIPDNICNIYSNLEYLWIYANNFCPSYPQCVQDDIGEQGTTNCNQLSVTDGILQSAYTLHNAYPNPFNPVTTLRYDLPENGLVNITIYDMMGREVKILVNGSQTAGSRIFQWNTTNNEGQPVSAGVYLYRIEAGEFSQTKKMILLK